MNKEKSGTATTPGASPEKQALLEAFDGVLKKQALDREAEQREAAAQRRSRGGVRPAVLALMGVVIALCAYLYLQRPEWLFPTNGTESVAIKEASLRIGMSNVAQHIERYRAQTGKLPATLVDAGALVEGMNYQPLDSADWRLIGTDGGIELTLGSGEPLPRFLGHSFEVIARRTP